MKIFAFFLTLVMLTLTACSSDTSTTSSSAPSSQSKTSLQPSSNSVSSSAPSSAAYSSSTSSSEASLSSSSQSEIPQQQSSMSSEASTSSSSIKSKESQQQSSASSQEESSINNETTVLEGYLKDEEYGIYSKIVSCSINNNVMTVILSAYAENPVNAEVSMDVWLSDDNSVGEVNETYSIDKLKEHSISMSSFWFEETYRDSGTVYEVFISIATTKHRFYFRGGKMWS